MTMRPTNWLAPIGLLAVAAKLLRPSLPGDTQLWVVGGLGLILTHLLLRWEDVLRVVGRRQLAYGSNMLVLTALSLGIVVTVNYLANRHNKRWDLTKGQRYSLAEQTKKILRELKDDVKVLYFQRESAIPEATKDRFNQYKEASPRVKLEYVDPVRDPLKTNIYAIGKVPTIVVEQGGRREQATTDSEQDITYAIVKVTRDRKRTVCFVEEEGERDPDDRSSTGYFTVSSELTRAQYQVKKVPLRGMDKVPEDCTVLVLAGPQKDLLAPVIDRIRAYLKAGGRAMILLEPDLKESYPNVVALLKEWDIQAGAGVVVDRYGEFSVLGPLAAMGPWRSYRMHSITTDLRLSRLGSAFLLCRTMEATPGASPGVTAQTLIETSPVAEEGGVVLTWVETEVAPDRPARFDADKDRKGPLPLAAVATFKVEEPPAPSPSPSSSPGAAASPSVVTSPLSVASPTPSASPPSSTEGEKKAREARIVAVGDADFPSNFMIRQGAANFDLFMNAVAWLAEDEDLISVRPKDPEDQRLELDPGSLRFWKITALGIVPAFVVALGIVTWWRRR